MSLRWINLALAYVLKYNPIHNVFLSIQYLVMTQPPHSSRSSFAPRPSPLVPKRERGASAKTKLNSLKMPYTFDRPLIS